MPNHMIRLYLSHALPVYAPNGKMLLPEASDEDLVEALNYLEQGVVQALNHGLSEWSHWHEIRETIKNDIGIYPKLNELPLPDKKIFHDITTMFPFAPSLILQMVVSNCNTISKNKAAKSYKIYPIPVKRHSYSLSDDEDGFCLSIILRSKNSEKAKKFRILIMEKSDKNEILLGESQKEVLSKIIEGEYKKRMCRLKRDGSGRWYADVFYAVDVR